MEVESQLAYGDVLKQFRTFFHFAVGAVPLCPGRGIAQSTVQEVLLAPWNSLLAFLAGDWWQPGRKKKAEKDLESCLRTRQSCGWPASHMMLYAAVVVGAGTFLVALSTERELHFTITIDIWIPQRLFCFYVFSRPLCPLTHPTGGVWVYKRFQKWASGSWECVTWWSVWEPLPSYAQNHHLQSPAQANKWPDK